MTDFRMCKDKPIKKDARLHSRSSHDGVFKGRRLTKNCDWRPDKECMTKARPSEPYRPGGVIPEGREYE